MFRNIVFDIDGTLVDSRGIFKTSLFETLDHFGIDLGGRSPEAFFGMSVEQTMTALQIRQRDAFRQEWEERFNRVSSRELLYPGVQELLEALGEKGVRMALLTSRNHATADVFLKSSGLQPFFLGCIAADDTQHHKPHPQPLRLLMERYDFHIHDTLFVGDSPADMGCARAVGIPFALALWNCAAQGIPCDHPLTLPEQVLALCK